MDRAPYSSPIDVAQFGLAGYTVAMAKKEEEEEEEGEGEVVVTIEARDGQELEEKVGERESLTSTFLLNRTGHFRCFFIFSVIKNDFLHF